MSKNQSNWSSISTNKKTTTFNRNLFNWTLFLIVSLDLVLIFLKIKYFDEFIELIEIIVSGIPGLLILLIISSNVNEKEISKFYKWTVKLISFIIPSLTTYYLIGKEFNEFIKKVDLYILYSLLIMIFLSTLLLTLRKNK